MRQHAQRPWTEAFVSGNAVSLLHDGAQCFPSMLRAIETARHDLEVTATVQDDGVGAALQRRFRRDLDDSIPVDLRHYRYRPPSERLFEHFFFLFRKLL